MDARKLAVILGITALLPLFLGLFVDAIYEEPKWDDYCKNMYPATIKEVKPGIVCEDWYFSAESKECMKNMGTPIPKYDSNNCPVYDTCDYCQRDFNNAKNAYNRNVFYILAPIGLLIVIIGIYFTLDYIGAGLMFGGLITIFYATVKFFISDSDKLIRSLIILIELLIIIWIAYKKINPKKEDKENKEGKENKGELLYNKDKIWNENKIVNNKNKVKTKKKVNLTNNKNIKYKKR